HGFGLHSGALAAKYLGGALRVDSAGLGHGAKFTLDLPLKPPGAIWWLKTRRRSINASSSSTTTRTSTAIFANSSAAARATRVRWRRLNSRSWAKVRPR